MIIALALNFNAFWCCIPLAFIAHTYRHMSHSLMVNFIKCLRFFNKNTNEKPPSISRKYMINVFKRKKAPYTHTHTHLSEKQSDDRLMTFANPICEDFSRSLHSVGYMHIYVVYDTISKFENIANSIGHPATKIPYPSPKKKKQSFDMKRFSNNKFFSAT